MVICNYICCWIRLLSDLEGLAVSSQASAAAAITKIDDAFTDLADKRADLGAYMNRLGHALGNAETFAANMSDSNSRIVDTDYAKEMTEFARAQIVRQAGMAMLSQANAIPNQVLQLYNNFNFGGSLLASSSGLPLKP